MYFSDFTRRPVDEQKPCGTSPNSLDEFEEIKRQINNISKVTGRVSWKKVQQLSKSILIGQSKDFRCSCYYTVAAAHNEGLKGFVEGLNSILDLCVVYWFNAYPEHSRKNARTNAIEWMVEHSEKRIKKFTVGEGDLPLIEAGHQICLRIEEEMRLHYGSKAPALGSIRRVFGIWIEQIREETARKESLIKETLKPQINPEQQVLPPSINVEVMPPKITKSKSEPKSKANVGINPTLWKSMIAGCVFCCLAIIYISIDHFETIKLEQRIHGATISQLAEISSELKNAPLKSRKIAKHPLISRFDQALLVWNERTDLILKSDKLADVASNLEHLYPDSSSVNLLSQKFTKQQHQLETDYQNLNRRFSQARTVFANVNNNDNSSDAEEAYRYSNSLFPLLGRIDYAEKVSDLNELQRSRDLINIYLYKITQIQNDMDAQASTIQ
ncbi:type VI secretion system ImpA family N-terminal domain-containing protein [Vibrio sp. ZSDE26]|uniref:Type VI secretion system ImpA family N-terminal domain-containing protein n=1 Tax=Vibrio amylolyticus TaxID=2847292 RepID=A0A9X1XKT9_9VIBR|nr:type VI secretion system ImpA family N-terminal domain-containing protein [Vibrio amylolyticus]MCK6263563.1 type VI secretion system ImpA family N-terminal domain-containing protein [Vibrio amylolyticus]